MTERRPDAPSREQLLYWLHEASEIEHHLMCCYLYAAFSLKVDDARWTPPQRAAVASWRRSITSVALEEMSHLALVGNLFTALGASPHFGRPAFPVDAGPYPAGFVIRLAPFCAATIEHFKYLERPGHEQIADGAGFEPGRGYQRSVPPGRLSPGPRDYTTVGELYDILAHSLEATAAELGEDALFLGDPALQLDAALAPLPGVAPVTDLASALAAIRTIVTQGEGAGADQGDSHYWRFCRIGEELARHLREDPSFEPAWPAATNPVMNSPIKAPAERVLIDHPGVARWLDLGNALYTTSLRCLVQGLTASMRSEKATWLDASVALMRALTPVGQGLAARPAHEGDASVHAGLSFTPLRSLAVLPQAQAPLVIAERICQLGRRAAELPLQRLACESEAVWPQVIAMIDDQAGRLRALRRGAAPVRAQPQPPAVQPVAPPTPPTAPATPAAASLPERVRGQSITVVYDGKRCIHARHCVLDAPTVFKANTPGEWIYPDTVHPEALIGVAHNCPSGAIRYERHDHGPEEAPPPVNQLRVRENGPYALHAPLVIAGEPDGMRATLCRCGQSRRKPWCDGAHVDAHFQASGEPPTGLVEPLAVRDGPLHVVPRRNGPLEVEGPLEICAGTGRPVARVSQARLCRCGQSKNKPFCDLSHVAAGFEAAGEP